MIASVNENESRSLNQLTRHWSDGGGVVPQSAVVAISGPTLDVLVSGEPIKPIYETPLRDIS